MTINAEITRGKVIAVLTLPYFQYKNLRSVFLIQMKH